MKHIKQLLIRIIGVNNYRKFVVHISRILNNFHKKEIYNLKLEKDEIFSDKKNVFWGYYDYPSNYNEKILFLETSNSVKENAKIFYYDLKNKKREYLANTRAWNFQMGARVNWIYGNKVIFNDYDEKNGYISRIVDLDGKEIKKFIFPIYDISKEKKYSFFTDFTILNNFRPGYGYAREKNKFEECYQKGRNSIYRGDLEKNTYEKILDIEDIVKYNEEDCNNAIYHYINHISCSQYDEILIFFHLWIDNNNKQRNRVFIIDYNGNVIKILSDFDKASHYCFKNKEELLLTVVNNNKEEYRLYNIKNGKYNLLDFLNSDGHPTYISDNKFITDTYPDNNGMQHLFLCDEKKVICEIAQIYHNPKKFDEYRCDLHPRYSDKILTIDCVSKNYRTQKVFKINLLEVNENSQIRTLKLSDSKKIYMSLYCKKEFEIIKYIYARLFDFSLNAHIIVNKMLKTKSSIKKNILFNRLQKKYSMWISPMCKIGQNIHFMHLDGITIGSGAQIGNNCTIYQQVTIGKEKDGFPIIGNGVTIYSGAKVIGNVKVGDNAVIGANAVVIKDVPNNCIAIGVPARIIERKI